MATYPAKQITSMSWEEYNSVFTDIDAAETVRFLDTSLPPNGSQIPPTHNVGDTFFFLTKEQEYTAIALNVYRDIMEKLKNSRGMSKPDKTELLRRLIIVSRELEKLRVPGFF
jgi:hypothetical protein